MSELLVPPREINDQIRSYGETVLRFASVMDFPSILISRPDHVMIKSSTPSDFDRKVKLVTPWAEQAAFLEVDSRFLVAAHLITPIALTEYKEVSWIEIMESKSPDGTTDYLGAEYAEFYHSDFIQAAKLMKSKRIDFEKRTDGIHRWWNIRLNEEGQELRISDKPLMDIIGRQLDDGTARELRLAA
jgi:hypothetical protein